jgi:hypothetical protein
MNMAMTNSEAIEAMLEDGETSLVKPEVTALEAITRSEVAMQLDSAHRYPRSVTKFMREAVSLATFSVEVAESCMYSVPRGGKMITGPSVRLAEMCATSWGNLHVGARVIDATATEVVAQAVAWDLQSNVRVTVEAQRSIVGKRGRFDDDMIRVTGMAAISIALRNAIFRAIPRAYVDAIYSKARECAVGDLKTLGVRRDDAFARFAKLGVTPERMFARLEIKGPDDFTLEHLEQLIGMYTAIKGGELKLDEAFPAVGPAPSPVPAGTPEGKRISLGKSKTKGAAAPVAGSAAPPVASAESKAAAPAEQPVDLVELHEALAEADDAWSAPGSAAKLIPWNEGMRKEALAWARDPVSEQPRPAHTVLKREPGDD